MGPARSPPTPPRRPSSRVHQHQVTPTSPRFLQASLDEGRADLMGAASYFSFGFPAQGGCGDGLPMGNPPLFPLPEPAQPPGAGASCP